MPCYSPLDAWRREGGGKLIFGSEKNAAASLATNFVSIPCGQCIGCRLDRSVNWAVRIMHESRMHEYSSFVTLTYDDEHLPYGGTLHYPHFQLFMKRLRKRFEPHKLRFFMCGEYGDAFGRPHYHAAIFGAAFADRYPWRKSSAGFQLYRSRLLEAAWDLGGAEIGDLSFESAAYVARYCTKKITGKEADGHYAKLVPETGEIISLVPEFARMSLKPGIGASWFDKYGDHAIEHEFVIMDGRKLPVPKFYKSRMSPGDLDEFEWKRFNSTKDIDFDNSPDRLRVREIVTRARFNLRSR